MLEQEGVHPDNADSEGQTPLPSASLCGNSEIVKMLLERNDVNPNTRDETGRTPLSWSPVGWVSESDNNRDREGRTQLGDWVELRSKCAMVAEKPLERNDVNPDTADDSGRTPLSWAASYVRRKIVEMLLQRNDVNPNTLYRWGGKNAIFVGRQI